ncbi:MAG: type III secretion system chaperone [Chlamydiales bacterium]|nr:type III secretion system chaperone [Chlamydiia bacterium]MCP5507835.1 type III secretion system chaperone [Chlamydiales bacterium]
MNIKNILLEYGKESGLGKLTLNEQGKCTLFINNTFLICFEPAESREGFFAYSVIEGVDTEDKDQLTALLQGNLFGSETGLASIGYDPVTRSIVFFEYFDDEQTDYSEFKRRMSEFVSYLHYWKAKLTFRQSDAVPKNEEERNIFYA